MNIHTNFQILTFILLVWYSCLRWWWFKKAPTINPSWSYDWANDGINKFTAYTSMVFLCAVLFAFQQTITTWLQIFKCISGFLFIRNVWYSIEDIYAYSKQDWNSQKEQTIFVLLDLLMVVDVFYWTVSINV